MKARYLKAKISRLKREIAEIDDFFYVGSEQDPVLYAGMLERKRDDIVRSTVLQLHTAIEDLLDSLIIDRMLGVTAGGKRSSKLAGGGGRALRRMLHGAGSIGFDMKLNLPSAIGLLNGKTRDQFAELNTLRNKCSHNWLLKKPVRRGRRPAQIKPPLLHYRGHDLHEVSVLKDFFDKYGVIYGRLFLKL